MSLVEDAIDLLVSPDGDLMRAEWQEFAATFGVAGAPDFDWYRFAIRNLGCVALGCAGRRVVIHLDAGRFGERTLAALHYELMELSGALAYELNIEWAGRLRETYDSLPALRRRLDQLARLGPMEGVEEVGVRQIDPATAVHETIRDFQAIMAAADYSLHDLTLQRLKHAGLWGRTILIEPETLNFRHVGRDFDRFFGPCWSASREGMHSDDGLPNPDYSRFVTEMNARFLDSGDRSRTFQIDAPNVWAAGAYQPTLRLAYEKVFALAHVPQEGRTFLAMYTQNHLPLYRTKLEE